MAADTIVCTVGVVAQEVLERDLRIDLNANGRDTMSCVLRKVRPEIHSAISVAVNGTTVPIPASVVNVL